jgi:hypothetical protein
LPEQATQPAARTCASAEYLTENVPQATGAAPARAATHHLAEDVPETSRRTCIPAAAGRRPSVGEHRQHDRQQSEQRCIRPTGVALRLLSRDTSVLPGDCSSQQLVK